MLGQRIVVMRGLGIGQKGILMALSNWSWLSIPYMSLCPRTRGDILCQLDGSLWTGKWESL